MENIPDYFIWISAVVALLVVLAYAKSAIMMAFYRRKKPMSGPRSGTDNASKGRGDSAAIAKENTTPMDAKSAKGYRSAFEQRSAEYQEMNVSRKLAIIVADKVALGKMTDATAQSLLTRVNVGQITEEHVLEMLKRL